MNTIAQPSVQSLFLEMGFNGQPMSSGTGFVAISRSGKPCLITNRHNVTGRNNVTGQPLSKTGGIPNEVAILHNKAGQLGAWVSVVEPLFLNDKPRWVEHPSLGSRADFVALPLTRLTGIQLYPYDPADSGPDIYVGPADSVSVIGFPFGLSGGGGLAIWATGFLASEPAINYDNLPVVLIDCRSRPGQSGSPVLAYRNGGAVSTASGGTSVFAGPVHRLIGIYSGRINDASDLGIVWKASAIVELLQSI